MVSGASTEKVIKYTKLQLDYLKKRWETSEGKDKRKQILHRLMDRDTKLDDLATFSEVKTVPKVPDGKDLRGIILSMAFPEDLDFSFFHLSGARIEASNLTNCDFSFCHLEEISFRGSILKNSLFKGAFLTNPDFVGADLEGISLSGSIIDNIQIISHRIFGEKGFKDFKDTNGFIDKQFLIYGIIKGKYKSIGRFEEMVPFHMLEMRARRNEKYKNKKTGRKKIQWYLDFIGFDLLCGYGEKWQNPLISAFIMMLLFTFLYLPYPLSNQINPNVPGDKFVNYLYFSCVTFSNYGSQDFLPSCDYHRLIMFIESIIGLICVTMAVVIYSRKMIRE
jgi:hypothetical protein